MWRYLYEHVPSGTAWFLTALSAIVPYVAYRINKRLHELTDPPWKRPQDSEE